MSWFCFHYIYNQSWIIAGSYSNIFNFLRNLHFVFHSISTNLYSHQKYSRIPFLQTSLNTYLIVTVIFISLIMNDIEHHFMYLVAVCMSSLENVNFSSFVYFFNHTFFCYWVLWVFFLKCILDCNSLSDLSGSQIFFPSLWITFSFCWLGFPTSCFT